MSITRKLFKSAVVTALLLLCLLSGPRAHAAMYTVKQSSTAYPLLFLMTDSSGNPVTGATCTVTLSKNAGAFAAPAGVVSEVANGWYKVAGNATDTNTLGPLLLHATASGALPTDAVYEVVVTDPQDAAANSTIVTSGTAQGGASGSITLASTASGTNNLYNGLMVRVYGGTGAGQTRVITGYVGSTKVASVDSNWIVAPDSTSTYAVIGLQAPKLDSSQQVTAASVTGNVAGNVTGSVGSISGVTFPANFGLFSIDGSGLIGLKSSEHTAITGDIWNATAASYNTANTMGAKLNSAANAGDPWSTVLPGSYGAGTAGNILGNRLDAAITSRLATGNVTVGGYAAGQDPATLVLAGTVDTGALGTITLKQSLLLTFMQSMGKFGTPTRSTSAPWTITVPFLRMDGTTTGWTITTTYTDSTFARSTGRTFTIGTLP